MVGCGLTNLWVRLQPLNHIRKKKSWNIWDVGDSKETKCVYVCVREMERNNIQNTNKKENQKETGTVCPRL